MNIKINQKKGRPTKQEQIELCKKLQQYYEKDYSPTLTHRETKINIKTISKYFKKWNVELLKSSDDDFLNRCKVIREKGIIELEKEIESVRRQEMLVESMIQRYTELGDFQKIVQCFKLKLKFIETKAKLLTAKINLVSTPTYDTILELNSGGMGNDSNR